MVPRSSAESGMMLPAVPAWIAPTVTTPNSAGSFSRLTTVCTSVTKWAACTIGSIALVRRRAVAAAALEVDLDAVGGAEVIGPAR